MALVETVLITIVLVLIGAVGWLVYTRSSDDSTSAHARTSTAVGQTDIKPSTPALSYAGWGTYTDTTGWFTLRYPPSWVDITPKAGTVVDEGPDSTPTTLTTNADGQLTPAALNGQMGPLLNVDTDTYSGTVQSYIANHASDSAGQTRPVTVDGYEALYSVANSSDGDTLRAYEVFNDGKVAILNFVEATPTGFDGTPGRNYSQYDSDEDGIAQSIKFVN